MTRVLIVQDILAHYRVPVYRELAKTCDLTVVHSGAPAAVEGVRELISTRTGCAGFFWQSGVLGLTRSAEYDVVIVMFDVRWISNVLGILFGKSRVICWGHRYGRRPIVNRFREWLMKRCDGVLLYSACDLDRVIAAGIKPGAVYVANNTIHVPNARDCSSCRKRSFIFVGRLEARKRVNVLIQAFRDALCRIDRRAVLEIVGDGSERGHLEDLVARSGLKGKVIFHGSVTEADRLATLFSGAIAYVSPGPVGLGAIHSFAYGVPVVTARAEYHGPEFSNLEHGRNAIIFGQDFELTDVLGTLWHDRRFAKELGRAAFETYSQRCSMAGMVSGFVAAIDGGCGQGITAASLVEAPRKPSVDN